MIAAQIESGTVVNLIVVDDLGVLPGLVDGVGARIGDMWDGAVFTEPDTPPVAPAVPQSVTRRQALQALILRGLDDEVDAALAAIPDPIQRKLAQAEFAASTVFERYRPLVLSIGAALGLDLDDLFSFADTL